MKFLITVIAFIATLVLNKFFPEFFSKIFDWIFGNNSVCIMILIFAIIGCISIASIFWRELSEGVSTFKSKK